MALSPWNGFDDGEEINNYQLLTPVSYAVLALAILWTAVISIWLFTRSGQEKAVTGVSLDAV